MLRRHLGLSLLVAGQFLDRFLAVVNPCTQVFFIPRPCITLDILGEFILEAGIGAGLASYNALQAGAYAVFGGELVARLAFRFRPSMDAGNRKCCK